MPEVVSRYFKSLFRIACLDGQGRPRLCGTTSQTVPSPSPIVPKIVLNAYISTRAPTDEYKQERGAQERVLLAIRLGDFTEEGGRLADRKGKNLVTRRKKAGECDIALSVRPGRLLQ